MPLPRHFGQVSSGDLGPPSIADRYRSSVADEPRLNNPSSAYQVVRRGRAFSAIVLKYWKIH